MKKKLIPLVTLSALLMSGLTALAACNKSQPKSTEGSTSEPAGEKFAVSYEASEQYAINGLKESYAAGETVTFTVTIKDSTKQISAVRAGGERISPDKDGNYSFTMPEENVRLRITLTDADVVTLSAFYSGNPMVGETLTITTKIDFAENNTFTVTAKEGASLVEITGHQVKCKGTGRVVLTIAASKDGKALSTELAFNIFESESGLGQNIAYTTKAIKNGGESLAADNPGTLIYWFGDGGNVSSIKYETSKDEFDVQYSVGWAFYGVQFFYSLPYAQTNDNYKLRWEVNSDAAGTITINSTRVDLKQGDNLIGIDFTQTSGTTVSIQLGYTENDTHHPLETGTHLKFKPFRIYDANATHKYHKVTFALEGETLKDIYVRDGQKVSAPEVTTPQGKIFTGFFNGETKYDENVAPTTDINYVAKFVNKTEENTAVVTLKLGDKELTKVDVYKGNKLLVPSGLDYGFGQRLKALYKDAALTQAYDVNSAVNGDVTLYVKTQISFEATYLHDVPGNKIPDEWTTYNDDGSVTLKFKGWGHSDKWHIQANFVDSLIRGSVGESYTITFVYSINVEGAGAQVYDGNTLDSANLDVGNKLTATLTYEGGAHEGDFKLTFELGGIDLDVDVIFTLHSIAIKKN